jgi:hypothetical protein
MADQEEQGNSQDTKKTVVRATVASLASGAIAYLIRKAAPAIREKLQSIGENGSVPGAEALGKAKDAVGEKVEAATSVVTDKLGGGNSEPSKSASSASKSTSSASKSAASRSKKELESRVSERAQNRRKRQKATTTK